MNDRNEVVVVVVFELCVLHGDQINLKAEKCVSGWVAVLLYQILFTREVASGNCGYVCVPACATL